MWKRPTSIAKKNSTASRLAISQQDIEKVLRSLTTEKPGLLAGLLSQSINKSIKMDYFPKMHRLLATPVVKEQMAKSMLNYHSIFCVLNRFSNIYENILKAQLMEK